MSAAPVHRLPPRRTGVRLWSMRLFGLLATAALLASGPVAVLTIAPGGGEEVIAPQAAPAATPEPAADKPSKPEYTAAQRADRRAAVATLREQGYRPVTLADYDPRKDLRVLIGRGEGGRRAFFFDGDEFVGTDAAEDSERVSVVRAGNRSVSLSYRLFEADGDRCCSARVLFRWDGESLTPQTAIPPAAERRRPLG